MIPISQTFLATLAITLCVGTLVTVVFRRFGQPVVLGYVVAGMIVGPHIPIPLVANVQTVSVLADLGAILIMLGVGLEFRLTRLFRMGYPLAFIASFEFFTMFSLGFAVGQLFGWTTMESVFTGAVIAITSTPLVIKALSDEGIRGAVPELVVGISIFEDLIGILLIALLSAASISPEFHASAALVTFVKLFAFLVAVLVVGFLLVPRMTKAVVAQHRPETIAITAVGLGFALALLAGEFGYSMALGAFLAGSLMAESGESRHILPVVGPIRDVFAAVFFVSVGMLIDPALLLEHWIPVVALSATVIVGKFLSVALSAFLAGNSVRDSVQLGLSFGQIGEFTLIIAGIGLASGATRDFLYPVAASVCVVTTFTTPYLIRVAPRVAAYIDRKLPKPLQTYVSLYGAWFSEITGNKDGRSPATSQLRQMVRYLVLDTVALSLFGTGSGLLSHRAVELAERFEIPKKLAWLGVMTAVAFFCAPLVIGMIVLTGRIAAILASKAFSQVPPGTLDRAVAPRRALRATLQFTILFFIFLPLLFLLQLLLPAAFSLPVLGVFCVTSGIYIWRTVKNLEGHVQAGVLVIAEALSSQVATADRESAMTHVRELLAGMGSPEPVRIPPSSPVAGKTLGEINLRGLTGATALAVFHGAEAVQMPSAHEVVKAGDTLVLTGSSSAIESAKRLLIPEASESAPEPPQSVTHK